MQPHLARVLAKQESNLREAETLLEKGDVVCLTYETLLTSQKSVLVAQKTLIDGLYEEIDRMKESDSKLKETEGVSGKVDELQAKADKLTAHLRYGSDDVARVENKRARIDGLLEYAPRACRPLRFVPSWWRLWNLYFEPPTIICQIRNGAH